MYNEAINTKQNKRPIMAEKQKDLINNDAARPQTSLLKILGFILLVGTVTLVSCQSAIDIIQM